MQRRNSSNALRATLTNLGLFVGTLVLMFAGLEVYLRIRHGKELRRIAAGRDEQELCTVPAQDPRLIYTFARNRCGANSQGYIDYEYTIAKPDDVFRILVIGDSVAQGRFVGLENSFCKLLEVRLNERPSRSTRCEVIVLARLGYSTSQEIVLLEEEAFSYEPDVILWSYVLNDPAHPVYHNANGELGRYFYRPTSYVAHFVTSKWFWYRERLRGRGCDTEYHAYLHCVYWDDVVSNIRHIGALGQREGVPVFFLIHPIFERIDRFSDYTLRGLHQRLAETAEGAGMEAVDLLAPFEPYAPDTLRIHRSDWYDPWHPNELGQRLIADYLFERLRTIVPR